MKKILIFLAFLVPVSTFAQTGAVQGYCELGGTPSSTSGLNSSNYMQGVIPQCTVTVYLTGTTTLATIYKDATNTPQTNPFNATKISTSGTGKWIFWAATNAGLDVQMSAGIPPNTFPNPVTLTDIFPSSSFTPLTGVTQIIPGTAIGVSPSGGTGNVTVSNTGVTQIIPGTNITISPSGGTGAVTINSSGGGGLTIQHNGSATGIDQTLLNFDDTAPAPPAGAKNVTFQTTSGGQLSGYVPVAATTAPAYVPTTSCASATDTTVPGATLVLTCNVVNAGDVMVVPIVVDAGIGAYFGPPITCAGQFAGYNYCISISDSQGNKWFNAAFSGGQQYSNVGAVAVSAGAAASGTDTITITFSSAGNGGGAVSYIGASRDEYSGVNPFIPLVSGKINYFYPGPITSTSFTGAPTQTNDMLVSTGMLYGVTSSNVFSATGYTVGSNAAPAAPNTNVADLGSLYAVSNYSTPSLWSPTINWTTGANQGYVAWLELLGAGNPTPATAVVNQITAGPGITINPGSGTGIVNVSANSALTSGVQYNPPSTVYVMAGSSLLRDDNHAMSNAYTVTGGSANGSTCSVTASNTLTTSDWVSLGSVTGFTTPTSGTTQEIGTNYTEFPVTAATSSSFTLGNCNFTATFTGGTAYQATYWIPYQTAVKPFFNGHGSVIQLGIWPSGGTYGLCTDQNTNYATFYHPVMTTGAGPHYYIVNDCHNDFGTGSTASTVETAIEALAVKVHTDGGIFVLATPWSQLFTSCPACSTQANQYYVWEQGFLKSNTSPTGQYADFIVPLEPIMGPASNTQLFADTIGRPTAAGADLIAQGYNFGLATQGNPVLKSDPFSNYRESSADGALGRIFTPPVDSYGAFAITNAAETQNYFNVDTAQGIVTEQRQQIAGNNNNDVLNVSNTETSLDQLAELLCPDIGTGSNGVCALLLGGKDTAFGDAFNVQFTNQGPGAATNQIDLGFYGNTKPGISMQYNGGLPAIFLPSIAPASGGPYCLQISATGSITNTGAACGGGGGGVANITIATGTTAVPANSCLPTTTTYNTASMTGLLTSSAVIGPTTTADLNGVTGFSQAGAVLYFVLKPTAGVLDWQLCNNTGSSITPSTAVTWNVGAN